MAGQYSVIFQTALELGAHTLESCIPADYTGACSVIAASDGTSVIGVLGTFRPNVTLIATAQLS